LGAFALISQFPYTFFERGTLLTYKLITDWNMLFTLFMVFCALLVYEKIANEEPQGKPCGSSLLRYRGEKGGNGAFHKWVFYWFYPLHFLVLAFEPVPKHERVLEQPRLSKRRFLKR
jgi:hypothetical protein